MSTRESTEQRFARALAAAEGLHASGRTDGQAPVESLEAFLAAHEDLRDLLEPMLSAGEEPPAPSDPSLPAASPPVSAGQPERFAHFDLVELLGSGAMGDVYLARDQRLQRTVALKLIQPAALWSSEAKERFRREARVVARLDHPHICKLYEADEHQGWPFLALQHIEGETLAARIAKSRAAAKSRGPTKTTTGARTRQAIGETVAMLETVARAVHHAHEQGVIHRDLKPGNIMLTNAGQPVVLDFGLARDERSLEASLSSSGRRLGTPLYMAPEQIETSRVDRYTDVYALGVILYECLTLERPFEGQTERELQDKILGSDAVAVDRKNRAVPEDLAVVVAKAMEKSPLRRYRTALALAEDLARVRAHEPVLARPVGVFGRAERWTRRNPIVALTLLALSAGSSASLWQFRRAAANLDRFLQMSDVPIVQDLLREEDEDLWPAHPDKLPQLRDWLERARAIEARLAVHRAALLDVRKRAQPASRELRREEQDLVALRAELDGERARLATARAPDRVAVKLKLYSAKQTAELTKRVADLESRLRPRERAFAEQRWRFASAQDSFAHQTLAELVRAIEGLRGPGRDLVASVVARRHQAETLAERSIGDEKGSEPMRRLAAAWREAASRLAEDARFKGFVLRPQLGLVPLGRDPESQLEEFAHLLSGMPAIRDEQGNLRIGMGTGVVLVLIPGGTFRMGAQNADPSQPNYDPGVADREGPVHPVTLEPYLLAKHEMTQGQWRRVAGENPSYCRPGSVPGYWITLRHPVEQVSWLDCVKMLGRLGLVLPTESQWERAGRAGSETPWWTGRDRSSLAGAANVADAHCKSHGGPPAWEYDVDIDDGHTVHAPVGSLRANPFGLSEMIGNVAEWCRDGSLIGYDRALIAADGSREPPGWRGRVARGGSWDERAVAARSACRAWYVSPATSRPGLGCRAAAILTR